MFTVLLSPPPGTRRASETIGQQGCCLKCFTLSERQPIYLLLITEGPNSARPSHPLFTTGTIGAAAPCLCQEKPSPSLSICRSCQPKAGVGSSIPTVAMLLHRRHRSVCSAQSAFEIWVTSGSVTTQSRDGAFRLEAALSAQGITQQLLALSFHGTQKSP